MDGDDPLFRFFFGPQGMRQRERREQGLGSGVVVDKGVVLTNNHVVDGASEIRITTADHREFEAEVAGTDPKSDLAALRIKGDASGLIPVAWGSSKDLRLGDTVLAIGNPFGVGETVTMGIVSAVGRADLGIAAYENFIQTDAAINPGNSGGALVNMRGELVGINTAILSPSGGNLGIGFAIPTDMARPILQALLAQGKVVRGWLGVGIQNVDAPLAEALGMSRPQGVLVTEVGPTTPAAKAGLKRGDVVLSVDGQAVTSTGELRNLVAAAGAGHATSLEILRDGKKTTLSVTLGQVPGDDREDTSSLPGVANPKSSDSLPGLRLDELDPEYRNKLNAPKELSGVLITGADPNRPEGLQGLLPGDVILELDRQPTPTVAALKAAWSQGKQRSVAVVWRRGRTLFVVLRH